LWFVLHYKEITGGEFHRGYYYDLLSEKWGINYRREGKTEEFTQKIYKILQDDSNASQINAIRRAKYLYEQVKTFPYSEQNPCTVVFKLVEELNKYTKK
ncbi:MAG: RloB domain-containing protein, partial [Bacteroidia bacterium]